jgi:hemolysin-activating ACP:hemolysin acyltransferase
MARDRKLRDGQNPPGMSMSAAFGGAPSPAQQTAALQSAGAMPQMTPEQEGFLRSRATAASVGDVVGAFLRSERHRRLTIADLEKAAIPAMLLGHFAVANTPVPNRPGETAPLAVMFWALVSPEVDARLSQATSFPLQLAREEWTSGDILWIVDAAGPAQVLHRLIEEVTSRSLGGRVPKMPAGAI